jgi:hypothetical protein
MGLQFVVIEFTLCASTSYENLGPSFDIEPPLRLDIINHIGGNQNHEFSQIFHFKYDLFEMFYIFTGRADCMANGMPAPTIKWLDNNGNSINSLKNVIKIKILNLWKI